MSMNLRDTLASHGIEELSVVYVEGGDRPDWAEDSDAWTVTLINHPAGETITVPFFTGPGPRGSKPGGPDAADVLSCLLADAAGVINADGYADWLSEFGAEDDERHRATYAAIEQQAAQLRVFLGELTEFYLWEIDHDA
jgi:hypothetical protein